MALPRRRLLWLAPAAAMLLGHARDARAISDQDQADVARIARYLTGITTLKARFLQISPAGASSTGKLWMQRPGRMRFEYDPPSPLLLVAGHGLVIFHDSSLDQTTNLPLGKTPLGILLQDDVSLDHGVTVTGVSRDAGAIALSLQRSDAGGEGSLTLLFADAPLALRGWIIHDAQGQDTRISLDDLDFAATGFNDGLFTYVDPKLFESGAP